MKDARGIVPVAIVVALALVTLHFVLRPDPSKRNFELFPDMLVSVAAESFAADDVMENGTTLQAPVEGVVVRGTQAFPYGSGPEEAKRAGAELVNPFPIDYAAVLARGDRIYNTYCIVCHDPQGGGHGTVVARGMVPPPSLLGARAVSIADGEMFHILTRGQGNMPSYAPEIAVEDRWKVIAFVRRLQAGAAR